jgi:hypothetical protein
LQDGSRSAPSPFVVAEEEGSILKNGPAAAAAELIVSEGRLARWGSKELTRLKGAVADEIIGNPMELVADAPRHHIDAGGAMPIRGVHKVHLNFELLDGIQREGDGRIVNIGTENPPSSIAFVDVLRMPPGC